MKIERKYLTFLSSAGFGDESLINAQNMDGATILYVLMNTRFCCTLPTIVDSSCISRSYGFC